MGKDGGIVGCYSPPGPVLLLCCKGCQERAREGWLLPRTHARNTLLSLPPQSVALHFSVVVSGLQVQRDGDEGGGGVSVEGGFGGYVVVGFTPWVRWGCLHYLRRYVHTFSCLLDG